MPCAPRARGWSPPLGFISKPALNIPLRGRSKPGALGLQGMPAPRPTLLPWTWRDGASPHEGATSPPQGGRPPSVGVAAAPPAAANPSHSRRPVCVGATPAAAGARRAGCPNRSGFSASAPFHLAIPELHVEQPGALLASGAAGRQGIEDVIGMPTPLVGDPGDRPARLPELLPGVQQRHRGGFEMGPVGGTSTRLCTRAAAAAEVIPKWQGIRPVQVRAAPGHRGIEGASAAKQAAIPLDRG